MSDGYIVKDGTVYPKSSGVAGTKLDLDCGHDYEPGDKVRVILGNEDGLPGYPVSGETGSLTFHGEHPPHYEDDGTLDSPRQGEVWEVTAIDSQEWIFLGSSGQSIHPAFVERVEDGEEVERDHMAVDCAFCGEQVYRIQLNQYGGIWEPDSTTCKCGARVWPKFIDVHGASVIKFDAEKDGIEDSCDTHWPESAVVTVGVEDE